MLEDLWRSLQSAIAQPNAAELAPCGKRSKLPWHHCRRKRNCE
jgi:hypothetical protein